MGSGVRPCLLTVALLVGISSPADAAETIQMVAVVDSEQSTYEDNLQSIVNFLNLPTANVMTAGNTVNLEIVVSRDNDSFSAMDSVCGLLPTSPSVIVDFSSRHVTSTIRSLAEAMGISHVGAVDPSFYEYSTQPFNVSVNFDPPESVMLFSIREIVSKENLTNVGIIYDNTFDLDNKPKRLLRNIPAQHLYLRMATDAANIKEQLDKIKSADLGYLFLACKAANAAKYLQYANEKGMLSFKYNWYILTKDLVDDLSCSGCKAGSTAIVMTAKSHIQRLLEYVRYSPGPDSTDQVTKAFQFDLLNLTMRALDNVIIKSLWQRMNYTDCYSFKSTDPEDYKQAVILKSEIQTLSQPGVYGKLKLDGDIAKQEIVLNIKRFTFQGDGVPTQQEEVGNWSMPTGLYAKQGTITNKNVKKSYRVITLREEPFVFKSETKPDLEKKGVKHYYYNETSKFYYYGYCIDLIYKINETMGFEFSLVEPPDLAYGTMQADGSWDGMVRELIDDRADIIVAPLSVMAERENVIDFTVPYYDLVGITILMKKPKFEYSVFKFMSVLEDAVWGCVFSAFIIVSVLLAVFDKFSPYSYQNNKDTWDGQGEEPRVFSLKEGLWFCMTSLTPQGGGEAPRALSGRLVAATWWMFGFIMIATYTANLAAFLTVSRLDQPIESLDDLAKQFKTKYAPQKSTSTETYFKRMADIEEKFYTIWKSMSLNDSLDQIERAKLAVWDYPVSDKFTNMWVSMTESGFPETFTEAVKRIKKEDERYQDDEFAFIGDATQNKYAILTDCELWEVGEEFSRKPYALAVQEGSPLKNELSSVILQLLNQRVLEDLKTFWWDYNRKECPKIEDESDGISIQNIGGVFLVIAIGIGLGLITLAFEYYWYKWRPAMKKKNQPPGNQVAVRAGHGHENDGYTK